MNLTFRWQWRFEANEMEKAALTELEGSTASSVRRSSQAENANGGIGDSHISR
jgi:hypothetical protein